MNNIHATKTFTNLQLLLTIAIILLMFTPLAYSCTLSAVTLYAGVDIDPDDPDDDYEHAEEENTGDLYVGIGEDVYFYAVVDEDDIENGEDYVIKWEFYYVGTGTADDTPTTDPDVEGDPEYLTKTSGSTSFGTAGTIWPEVICWLYDGTNEVSGTRKDDTHKIHVVRVDLGKTGLDDDSGSASTPHETDPGVFLKKDESTALNLSVSPARNISQSIMNVGTVKLTGHGTTLGIYEDADCTTSSATSWDMSDPAIDYPRVIYVKGAEVGVADLKLSFEYDNDGDSDPDDLILAEDIVRITVGVDLEIYNEHSGSKLEEADEESPGSFVLINKDDDDDDGTDDEDCDDTSIDEIGGSPDEDKEDMAKMKITVPSDIDSGLTIKLYVDDSSKVNVFDENDAAVTSFPKTFTATDFTSGALEYHVEGKAAGSATFTLKIEDGSSTVYYEDSVKVTVKDLHAGFVAWGAWPTGGENALEVISSSQLGLSGAVKWTVSDGGSGASIFATAPPTGTKFTAIVVKYNTESTDATFTKAIEIKAYDDGPDSKIAAVRRTVFKITYDSVNHNAELDLPDDTLRFPTYYGSATSTAGVVTPSGSVTWFGAKVEAVGNIAPTDIDWDNRGVIWVFDDPDPPNLGVPTPAKWQFLMKREKQRVIGYQTTTGTYRDLFPTDWANDGEVGLNDAKYPSSAKPNKFFRIDAPGFPVSGFKQAFFRHNFRESAKWHNGSSFIRCSPYANWYTNLTADYPSMAVGTPNESGTGHNADAIPNNAPVVTAGPDQTVTQGDRVSLVDTGTDADNDDVYNWEWVQTDSTGLSVLLSDGGYTRNPDFFAPSVTSTTVLEFTVTASDGTQLLTPSMFRPSNSSGSDVVEITVNP